LLASRAETQQQEFITKLSAAAKLVNKTSKLTKLQQVSMCVFGDDCGAMGLECCAVTAGVVCAEQDLKAWHAGNAEFVQELQDFTFLIAGDGTKVSVSLFVTNPCMLC
jgi:hypothetical protein